MLCLSLHLRAHLHQLGEGRLPDHFYAPRRQGLCEHLHRGMPRNRDRGVFLLGLRMIAMPLVDGFDGVATGEEEATGDRGATGDGGATGGLTMS